MMIKPFNKYVLPALLMMSMASALYMDSSSRELLDETNPFVMAAEEGEDEPAMAEVEEGESFPIQSKQFEVQERLVHEEKVDGYVVETYREYEIYKDESGNVEEMIPTSNYHYIRYKQ
jgi:hypothetical protein